MLFYLLRSTASASHYVGLMNSIYSHATGPGGLFHSINCISINRPPISDLYKWQDYRTGILSTAMNNVLPTIQFMLRPGLRPRLVFGNTRELTGDLI